MEAEKEKILNEIKSIQQSLDHSHDMDPDYLPPELRELKDYIFRVHAAYEKSLEMAMWRSYLKPTQTYGTFSLLFERMTFYDKQVIVHSVHPTFPNKLTTKLNELRNFFVHKKGTTIREKYSTNQALLDVYRLLKESHDALNNFWAEQLQNKDTA
jgi:hypothetical protein